ncbi:hypothetical protein ACIA5H_37620 [Nocardia sp. NPDC051900]|uniref:hypothetical protein n=1 Tax=Nocardia sp. NPDC051900 TaxID=3364326 RepID=UPI0037B239F0
MRYQVTAPLVIAQDHEGRAHHRYSGEVIQWLSPEQRQHLLDLGMVEEIPDATPPGVAPAVDESDEDESQPTPDTDPAGPAPAVAPEQASQESEQPSRPPQIAKKEIWVDWAVQAKGIDKAEAETMTLEQLKAL